MGKFIDFDKKKGMFYDNIWLDEHKIVVKMPLTRENYSDKHILIRISGSKNLA